MVRMFGSAMKPARWSAVARPGSRSGTSTSIAPPDQLAPLVAEHRLELAVHHPDATRAGPTSSMASGAVSSTSCHGCVGHRGGRVAQRSGSGRLRRGPVASPPVLLAIDVGNTQTVIGLFGADDGERPTGTGAERDLLDHWRIATNAERTSDELALLVQEFLGFHGFSFDEDVDGVALCSSVPSITAAVREMTRRYFGFEAARRRAGREDRHADPLREPQGGRRRPHRRRRRRLRPLRRPDDRRRLRHRHHPRGHLGRRASTSAAPSSPASRSASRRCSAGPPRCARSSWSSPAASSARTPSSRSSPAPLYGFAAPGRRHRRRGSSDEIGEATVVATGGLAARHRAVLAHDHRARAVAHAARPAPHLREEPAVSDRSRIPYRFEVDATRRRAAEPSSPTSSRAPRPTRVVTVAGRLMLRRVQGKLAFGTLQDAHRAHPAVRAGAVDARLRRRSATLDARRLDRRHAAWS